MLTREEVIDDLQAKLKALNQTLWEGRAKWPHVEKWLSQFAASNNISDDEQVQMLFLASHFMYFGVNEVRALLRSLFRDLYQYKVVQEIRAAQGGTKDRAIIAEAFKNALDRTRFIGIGNPSESGSHLLYYFRQENRLGKPYFIGSHDVFSRVGWWRFYLTRVRDKSIERYVFIDDLCGSGSQAEQYSRNIVKPLKQLNPRAKVSYFTLFATTFGLSEVKKLGWFDEVATVVELDESFKCFSDSSRYYKNEQPPFDKVKARAICTSHGLALFPDHPLGWRDGQLLIGFCHNTPDNSLPVIWYDEPDGHAWTPLFRRYPKHYGWDA